MGPILTQSRRSAPTEGKDASRLGGNGWNHGGVRRFVFGLKLVTVVLMAGGVTLASGRPSIAAEVGSTSSSLPSWLHETVHASAYVAPAAPFVPNVQPVGTSVPVHDVAAATSEKAKLRFGLATFPVSTQTYPAISTDGGATWKIAGPLFHVDALQGASVVGSCGVLPPQGAYFWGRGGNIIWITYDEGAHWWEVVFGGGVDEVILKKGTFEAVALGAQVKHAAAVQRFLYTSSDLGRTWKVRRQLAELRI